MKVTFDVHHVVSSDINNLLELNFVKPVEMLRMKFTEITAQVIVKGSS